MKIAYIAAGAAGQYCGNCLRDNALARALLDLGEEVLLVPAYTPLRTDLPDVAERRVFFNGIRVYLEEKVPYLRRPRPILDRLLGSRSLLSLVSWLRPSTDPSRLGPLTLSMLRGEEGHQRKEVESLVHWLRDAVRPDIVHLTNYLLLGLARSIRRELGVPVVCGLQSEDGFLDGLPEEDRNDAVEILRDRGKDVDAFIAVSDYYADHCAAMPGFPRESIRVVRPGIPLEGHEPAPERGGRAPAVGYLARMAPEKGLHVACAAFERLAHEPGLEDLRLKVAGYLGGRDVPFAASLRRRLSARGLRDRVEFWGTVDRDGKLALLREVDVLCVPTIYREPKGLFALEAMASGVPVVVPNHGVFPEYIAHTGGGVLHTPGDEGDAAAKTAELLRDEDRRAELGRRGRQAVLERFHAERMARETLDVYRAITLRAPSPPASR